MALRILTDNFVGSPEELYSLVIEEIKLRALPEIEFKWIEEAEFEKRLFFGKGEKARALRVTYKKEWITVFAIQIGACFLVSTRVTNRFYELDKTKFLYEMLIFTFETVVDRSTRRALARQMEGHGVQVPSSLTVSDLALELQQVAQ